ncbi:MAG: ATP-binding protein [Patescibacteria group bacterium]|nr:ATP-binding protein [Patescibacteria group bacterium]
MFWKSKKKENNNNDKISPAIVEKEDCGTLKGLSIISYLKDGILAFDKNNKLLLINSQAEKFLKLEKEKVLGRSVLKMSYYPAFRKLISLLGTRIAEVDDEEVQVQGNRILSVSSIKIKIQNEKITSLIILHDITREKMSQEVKSRFIALAAHQLRTPSSAVKWSTKMLLEGEMGELNPKQMQTIEKTYQTNERMIALINDLLDVTKIEEGKYISKKSLSDILITAKSAIELSKDMIKEKNIKLVFVKPIKPIPKIMIDKERMKIAIGNILDNAVRYTPDNGKISILIKVNRKEIEIQVKDNGIGIPYGEQREVFNIFHRGSNATKVDTQGTGLGLFIAKSIIEAHGGKVWFFSKLKQGTTFYLTLPTKEEFSEFLREDLY